MPVLVLKGVRKNMAVLDGMPPGSDLYMNKKSSFINTELFMKWLREVFTPRKPEGPVILILDGHTSHINDVDMLEYAEDNGIILLCLPSHTTQALQPLDRSFFKPLKTYYKKEAEMFMFSSKDKNINRNMIGKLIGPAWNKAATISNATSGFKATGIYPFNQTVIPDYFFQIADHSKNQEEFPHVTAETTDFETFLDEPENEPQSPPRSPSPQQTESQEIDYNFLNDDQNYLYILDDIASGEIINETNIINNSVVHEKSTNKSLEEPSTSSNKDDLHVVLPSPITKAPNLVGIQPLGSEDNMKETPSKFLNDLAPVPKIDIKKSARKQSAKILSSEEVKQKQKQKAKNDVKIVKKTATVDTKRKVNNKRKRRNTETEDDVNCKECLENYLKTTDLVDWIQCIDCQDWLHETCTMYGDRCNECGKIKKRREKVPVLNLDK